MPSAPADTLVRPAYFSAPDFHRSFGAEVADLAELAGMTPDPEQRLILDPMFGIDRAGRSVAFEVCVIAPRQNLKTGLAKIAALGKTLIMERPLFVWSAHEFSTAQEAFRDLTLLIEATPDLDGMVKRLVGAPHYAIEWLNGCRIKFKARTSSGGRGLTGDDVLLDEGFALRPDHMGALLPTLSARPDPQVMTGSSACQVQSSVLRSLVARGRSGSERSLIYAEWCAPDAELACDRGGDCTHEVGTPGCGFDRRDLIRAANPQAGRRITWEFLAAERLAFGKTPELRAEYGRERLGWHDDPAAASAIFPPGVWESLADGSQRLDGRPGVVLALDVSSDLAYSSICAAATRPGTDVVDVRVQYGKADPVASVLALRDRFAVTAPVQLVGRNAAAYADALAVEGVATEVMSSADRIAGCALLTAGVQGTPEQEDDGATVPARPAWLRHGGQLPLDTAVDGARWSSSPDGRVLDRGHAATDISPAYAVVGALFGLSRIDTAADYDVLDSIW